jgi:hypothetical protein
MYKVKVEKLEWTTNLPKDQIDENTSGTYTISIKTPLYKNIPSKTFKWKGLNPKHYSKDDELAFINKTYPYSQENSLMNYTLFICEDDLSKGEFDLSFVLELGR